MSELSDDIAQRWSIFSHANDIVQEKFEDGREYALDALRTAQETIERLSNLAGSLDNIDTSVTLDEITPPDISDFVAVVPDTPVIEVNMPTDLTEADAVSNAIQEKLLDDIIEGGPAIDEATETAIFERESERARILHNDEIDKISSEWASRNFAMPDGTLAALLNQSEIDYSNKRMDVSRDIAIKSFELGDANTKFAVQQGIAWYGLKIETYKAKVQAEISRIQAVVQAFIGEVEVYKGSAQVYTALADTKIKKFDAQVKFVMVRAELLMKDAEIDMKHYEMLNGMKIEAMKAIGGINAQIVAGSLSSVSASARIDASNSADYRYSPGPASTSTTTNSDGSTSSTTTSSG
jgi:hypothetical protein